MRYYTYISDAKLDLLYGQIPPKLLSRLSAEFRVDLKVVSMSVQMDRAEAARFDKLRIVERYLDENFDISGIADPAVWFRGGLGLRSVTYPDMTGEMLLFMGLHEDILVVLIGSAHHLVGRRPPPDSLPRAYSRLPELFRLLDRDEAEHAGREDKREASDEAALRQVLQFAQHIGGPREPCDFLARRLLCGKIAGPADQPTKVVVATPLYVALSDG